MLNEAEEKLIKRALDGDQDAWRDIYRRYYGLVKKVVAWGKWGFKYAEVEEVVQEVFMELCRALPRFRHEATLSTFLTRLSKNKCISMLRRKNAQKRAKEEYGFIFDEKKENEEGRFVIVESTVGNPEALLLFSEETIDLLMALSKISRDCQEIIKKRFFDGLSYNEICDDLSLPLGTVCSRLKRCLLKLREAYVKIKNGSLKAV